jgi:hypothetical protein
VTYPVGTTPEGGYDGSGGFADYAATTQEEWEDGITAAETLPWGESGLLGALFAGLSTGKPFVVALIEAILAATVEGLTTAAATVEDALADLGSAFDGKWRDLNDTVNAAAYANAQLAALTRPIVDLFDGAAGGLSANWDVQTVDSGGGEIQQDGVGNAWWDAFGGVNRGNRCRWNADQTATNSQLITIVMPTAVQQGIAADSYVRVLGHINDTSTITDYVYFEIGYDYAEIGYSLSGSETVLDTQSITSGAGDTWDVVCGDADSDYHFRLLQNGVTVVDTTDAGTAHNIGSGYRSVGFEMYAASRIAFISQTSPGKIAVFSADDATWGS